MGNQGAHVDVMSWYMEIPTVSRLYLTGAFLTTAACGLDLVRYSRLLEEGDFRGRTANYVLMLLFGVTCISLVAVYTHVHFLGSALTFMMVYVWGRRNEDVRMSFLGFFTFNAPYLPWVMLGFSVLIGNGITMDIIGIAVGHTYYFLEFVYPVVAEIRGWRLKRILEPPTAMHWLCGNFENHLQLHQD
eukprot:scaffold10054_cov140-Cylindrotheca_fusiformis.AAC.6